MFISCPVGHQAAVALFRSNASIRCRLRYHLDVTIGICDFCCHFACAARSGANWPVLGSKRGVWSRGGIVWSCTNGCSKPLLHIAFAIRTSGTTVTCRRSFNLDSSCLIPTPVGFLTGRWSVVDTHRLLLFSFLKLRLGDNRFLSRLSSHLSSKTRQTLKFVSIRQVHSNHKKAKEYRLNEYQYRYTKGKPTSVQNAKRIQH